MKLFNRDKEINQIIHILEGEPNFIYFIYGPINSGKSTLLREIIVNRIDNSKYIPFFIDFRTRNVLNVDNFIECLFEVDENPFTNDFREYAKSLANILIDSSEEISKYYIGTPIKIPKLFFKSIFDKNDKSGDVYQYLEYLFVKLNEKGKTPILIFDELQMIKEITTNGSSPLLKSLFQFLVAITKVQHICHCLCLTSDSLFAEYVYNTGELEGRAKYLLIDDFNKQTSLNFIDFLNNELMTNKVLTNEDKERIYNLVGGKPYDIYNVIDNLRYDNLDNILDRLLKIECSKLKKLLIRIKNNNFENINYNEIIKTLSQFKNNY